MTQPTIYLTNWSTAAKAGARERGYVGPAPCYTIMASPRAWEHGGGAAYALLPTVAALRAVKAGTMTLDAYRKRFVAQAAARDLSPGALLYGSSSHIKAHTVPDGATLCCSCSRDAAAHGECHRAWAAELLRRAGWRVVLDGRELAGVDEAWAPVFCEGRKGCTEEGGR